MRVLVVGCLMVVRWLCVGQLVVNCGLVVGFVLAMCLVCCWLLCGCVG